jgi:predicted ester cyclase
MPVEENMALARRFLEAHVKGDLDAVDEMLASDFVGHTKLFPGQEPGREGVKWATARLSAAISNVTIFVEDQVAGGDKVVTRFIVRATHDRGELMGVAPTGTEMSNKAIAIHRIEGGKIAEEWSIGTIGWKLRGWRLEQERIERERVEQELQVARRIQQASLPKEVPEPEGWESYSSPGVMLQRVNEALCPNIPANMFVTCFYAVLDPKSGRVVYANAGHDLPYLHHDGDAEELRARGMPLGLMPGMSYEQKEIVIEPRDSALFYSDGLVEAHDPKGEMFGFPRLRALAAEHGEQRSLGDFLLEELYSFVGEGWEQEDDITLVTLRRAAASR